MIRNADYRILVQPENPFLAKFTNPTNFLA